MTSIDMTKSLLIKPYKFLTMLARRDIFFVYFHLILSILFFLPYFLFNYILVGTRDTTDICAPSLLYQLQTIMKGEFPLWNPFQYSGTPSSLYANGHIYLIENILFLLFFPLKYIFTFHTFLNFIKFFLVGVFSYYTFLQDMRNRKIAFFSSLICQFSAFFYLNIIDLYSVWFYMVVALYLIWTLDRRGCCVNYILIALILYQMLLPSHLVSGIYAMLIVVVMFLYRYLTRKTLFGVHLWPFVLAYFTIIFVFMIRLIPMAVDFVGSSRDKGLRFEAISPPFYLGLFDAEIFGFNSATNGSVLAPLNTLFGNFNISEQQYFGVIPILMSVLAILLWSHLRFRFWVFHTLFIFCGLFWLNTPAAYVSSVLTYPMQQSYKYMTMSMPFSVAMLAGSMLSLISRHRHLMHEGVNVLRWTIGVVCISILTLWSYYASNTYFRFFQILFLVLIVIVCLSLLVKRSLPAKSLPPCKSQFARELLMARTNKILLVVCASLISIWFLNGPTKNMTDSMYNHILMVSGTSFMVAMLLVGIDSPKPLFMDRGIYYSLFWIMVMVFLAATFIYVSDDVLPIDNLKNSMFISIAGFIRFIVIGWALLFLFIRLEKRLLSRKLFLVILIVIQVLDIPPAFKIHSFVAVNPFFKGTTLFPEGRRLFVEGPEAILELKHYRVSNPNGALELPYYQQYYQDQPYAMAGGFQAYNFRSVGGYVNASSRRYCELILKFTENSAFKNNCGVAVMYLNDHRALSLLGAKYGYDGSVKMFNIRHDALARFMFFPSFVVEADPKKVLEHFADSQFDFSRNVVLENNPGFSSGTAQDLARRLDYHDVSNHEIHLNVHSDVPGIVLFNDNYHPAWRANVNSKPVKILYGNYAFMAISIPAGDSSIDFRFEPDSWKLGRNLAMSGVFMFFLISSMLCLRERKVVSNGSVWLILRVTLKTHIRQWFLVYSIFLVLAAVVLCQSMLNFNDLVSKPRPIVFKDIYKLNLSAGSSSASTANAAHLVDGIKEPSSMWDAGLAGWWKYDFGTRASKVISNYVMYGWDSSDNAPATWTFEGSNDDVKWQILDEQSKVVWRDGEVKAFSISKPELYRYYRLNITAPGKGYQSRLLELELFSQKP